MPWACLRTLISLYFLWRVKNPSSQGSHSHFQMPTPRGTNNCHLPSTLGGGAVDEAGHGGGEGSPFQGRETTACEKDPSGIQAVT